MKYLFSSLLLVTVCSMPAAINRTVATIPVGYYANAIVLTPDGRFAYVANEDGYSITVLDLLDNTVVTTITDASFNRPYLLAINPAGTKVYATNGSGTTVSVISTITNAVTGVIHGFTEPTGIVITPDGNTAYVSNYDGTTVRTVNLYTNSIVGSPITVGSVPAFLAITPDGAYVYVANYVDGGIGTGSVSVIRTSDNSVVATIPGFTGPYTIAITPDGSKAYVANFGNYNGYAPYGTTVTVIDTKTNTIMVTLTLGIDPCGIAITPDGNFAYVTNFNAIYVGGDYIINPGTINIINTQNQQVLERVVVAGEVPDAIAISPDGSRAYVTNFYDETVTVITILDQMWLNA